MLSLLKRQRLSWEKLEGVKPSPMGCFIMSCPFKYRISADEYDKRFTYEQLSHMSPHSFNYMEMCLLNDFICVGESKCPLIKK